MSVSPKYRTNFSVTDILSPLDETTATTLQPGRQSPNSDPNTNANDSSYLLLNSIITGTDSHISKSTMSVPVSTPFGVHQLGMHPPQPTPHGGGGQNGSTPSVTGSSAFSSAPGSVQYTVNGTAELTSAYGVSAGDVRAHPPAPWYTSSASDPRFASDYTLSTGRALDLSINVEILVYLFMSCFVVSRLMSSTAPSVNMNMTGMNMNMTGMNMNMNMSMPGIGAACGAMTNETKPCGVQFPLHAQRRKRRVLFTQAQVGSTIYL